jgi:hypothetical protein
MAVVAAPMVAQESTGQIVGTVKSKTGELIAGAEVRLTSPVMQGVRTLTTDAKGGFRAPFLPPGAYKISVNKDGFIAPRIEAEVGLGQILRQEILMVKAGATSATVEVVASSASVDKTDVKASTNVSSEMMDMLPRTTRGMNTVALLTPGVTLNATSRVQIRGGQGTGNRFLLNGSDISDNAFGTSDGRSFFVDDSIQEMQVISSPINARYGGFTGGVINSVTKQGSNDFTGIMRATYTRSSWNAIAPRGLRPTGTQPSQGVDDLARNYTVWLGGPILKDMLWFTFSSKQDPASSNPTVYADPAQYTGGTTTGDVGPGSGAPAYLTGAGAMFNRKVISTFTEYKLTGALGVNHTLSLSGSNAKDTSNDRAFVSSTANGPGQTFDPRVLGNGYFQYSYQAANYKGILSSNANLEVNLARKKQKSVSGGMPADGDTIFARYASGYRYQFNNGIFNHEDGGDNRNIDSATANLQWFSPSSALGTHQIDAGFEILRQKRTARNDQSPNNRRFITWGRNADGTYRAAGLNSFAAGSSNSTTAFARNYTALYYSDGGTANTNLDAYYINDVWTITNKLQFSMGVRYDKVSASDTFGMSLISSSQTSPRFKLTYDMFGDQSWLASLSSARYTSKLQDGFANQFSLAGNPIQENFGWKGALNNSLTTAQVQNLANWDISAAGLQGVSSPANQVIDAKTKSPYADELSANLKHSLPDGSFIGFTYTMRTFKNFFNDFTLIGDETNIALRSVPVSSRTQMIRWRNDDRLKRDYKSLEIEFMAKLTQNLSLAGNYTYSILKGNGEGSEGQSSTLAVTGDVIGDLEDVHIAKGRPMDYYAPYGTLAGDVPHRVNIHLDYFKTMKSGTVFTSSLLFNYNSGTSYSLTRANDMEAIPMAQAAGSSIYNQYQDTYTRYFGPRGIGRFNDTFNFDLKLAVDVPIVSKVRYFCEMTVLNLFNHWQLSSYSVSGVAGDNSLKTNGATSGFLANNWTTGSPTNLTGYGTYGYADYIGGRVVRVSTGIKW